METRIPLEEARSHLDDLLHRVEEGERIVITRAGRDLAELRRVEEEARASQLPSLEKWRSSISAQGESLSETINKQREEERY